MKGKTKSYTQNQRKNIKKRKKEKSKTERKDINTSKWIKEWKRMKMNFNIKK